MYVRMMPKLEAQARLDGITAGLAVQNRMLEDHSRQRYITQLEQQLTGERRAKRATEQDMSAMGVQVVIEPPEKKPEGGGD